MDLVTAQLYLAEAETARHKLATGAREVEIVAADGRRVTYALANMADLEAYIGKMRGEVAAASAATTGSMRRPIGFRYGR